MKINWHTYKCCRRGNYIQTLVAFLRNKWKIELLAFIHKQSCSFMNAVIIASVEICTQTKKQQQIKLIDKNYTELLAHKIRQSQKSSLKTPFLHLLKRERKYYTQYFQGHKLIDILLQYPQLQNNTLKSLFTSQSLKISWNLGQPTIFNASKIFADNSTIWGWKHFQERPCAVTCCSKGVQWREKNNL